MATKRKLGVYWGQNILYFVEAENTVPKKIFSAPFEWGSKNIEMQKAESTEGIKLTATIQRALQGQQILDATIALAIPPQDIIFRSFVIPSMQPTEVKNVVEFESPKYVPFRLEELNYTYFPLPFTENKKKSIRILLVAVRKIILENYCSIFEHSGLRVELIEPATVSLIRVLFLKKLIPKNRTTAIIEFSNTEGRITIIDRDVPQFVREFQFYPSPENTVTPLTPDILRARLFNEIKISFDYFGRQYAQKKIEKILPLSRPETVEILKTLGTDFNIPATLVDLHGLMNAPSGHEIGFISAFGICLRNTVAPKINFDLTWKVVKTKEEPEAEEEKQPNYMLVAITACVCLVLIGLTTIIANRFKNQVNVRIEQIKKQLGPYESLDIQKLEKETQEIETKIVGYKEIRLKSQVAHFLKILPDLLPPGTWISDLDITFQPMDQVNLSLTAHAYAKEANKQIELVNNLVKNLKNNNDFSSAFGRIDLGAIETDRIQEYSIARFRITCR